MSDENQKITNILCLSGWAQPYDSLAALFRSCDNDKADNVGYEVRHLDYHDYSCSAEVMHYLSASVGDNSCVVGWSMGGALLMQAISYGYISPARLVLISTPVQFVACESFTNAMDKRTYNLFLDSYKSDAQRTSKRFASLIAKGDSRLSDISFSKSYWHGSADRDYWLPWLEELGEQKHHHHNFELFPPTLILHGKNDAIVDYRQSLWLSEKLPSGRSRLLLLDNAGHAPHLHDSILVRNAIQEHCFYSDE